MTQENTTIEPIAYRVLEFCQKYVISKSTFYREVRAERLQLLKRGRTTLVLRAEAERWFSNLAQYPIDDALSNPGGSDGLGLTAH